MTANSLYSNFIDAADINGNIKKNKNNLDYLSILAGGIIKNDLYNELLVGGVYPIVGNNINSYKLNFMDPNDNDAAKRLVFNGGFTINDLGIKSSTRDGKFINTFITVNNFADLHFCLYSNDSQQASTDDIDCGVDDVYMSYYPAGSRDLTASFRGFGANSLSTYTQKNNGLGVNIISYKSTDSSMFINDNKLTAINSSTLTGTKSTNPVYIFGRNVSGVTQNSSVKRYSFISIGLGLTAEKAVNWSNLIRVLQGIKNRL